MNGAALGAVSKNIDRGRVDSARLLRPGQPGHPREAALHRVARFQDQRHQIITATHGHSDHVGDLALFQRDAPGVKTYISERDVQTLESGGNVDYRRPEGRGGYVYDPIKVDVRANHR